MCPNCGAATAAPYCGECGQEQRARNLSLRAWLRAGATEVLALDSRLVGTVRTLVLRPGELSAEWSAAHYARYISPLRTFLLASALFFVVFFQLGFPNEQLRPIAGSAELSFMQGAVQSQIQTLIMVLIIVQVPRTRAQRPSRF